MPNNRLIWVIEAMAFFLILSFAGNIYQYFKYTKTKQVTPAPICKECNCPNQDNLTCKDFTWVSEYIEIVEGEIKWFDCNEGQNKCATWEDFSGLNPYPIVEIKGCTQEGTSMVNGKKVTGLPVGRHVLVGATIRPCEGDTPQAVDRSIEPIQ